MVSVAADVGVQESDGKRAVIHLAKTRDEILVNIPRRITDPVHQSSSGFIGENGYRLKISAKSMAPSWVFQPRFPPIQWIVVAVAHE